MSQWPLTSVYAPIPSFGIAVPKHTIKITIKVWFQLGFHSFVLALCWTNTWKFRRNILTIFISTNNYRERLKDTLFGPTQIVWNLSLMRSLHLRLLARALSIQKSWVILLCVLSSSNLVKILYLGILLCIIFLFGTGLPVSKM